MKNKVAIIGGGVSGITTGILLQENGFDVNIYTAKNLQDTDHDALFPSLYPSASVIPHSVFHPDLNSIFKISQHFFLALYNSHFPGLTVHDHFELFGERTELAQYADMMNDFEELKNLNWYPAHPKIDIKSGWKFECFFADWSIYFPHLIKKFIERNGTFTISEIDLNTLSSIKEAIVVNCSGMGSHQLNEESQRPLILKGHLLKVATTQKLESPKGTPVSYNFTPGSSYYSDSSLAPMDVYCYPRKNDWILGGSRFEGTLDRKGNWVSNDQFSEVFPEEIEILNSDIIKKNFGLDIKKIKKKEQLYSFRYVRNRKNGLRIETDRTSDRLLIHNYGHGGAGVTLSWGCAFRCLELIQTELLSSKNDLNETISKVTQL
jgi:hypothetical protein